jgi:hypothetical protein
MECLPKNWGRDDEVGYLREEVRLLRDTLVRVQTVLGSAVGGDQLILVARHAVLAEEELAEIDVAILAGEEVPRRKATMH